ncbi:MAG TPA: hypothetical protein DD716_04820 [Thiomicrospira sp.]|nr:hypothetical protein [Thiomicrospira sp.]
MLKNNLYNKVHVKNNNYTQFVKCLLNLKKFFYLEEEFVFRVGGEEFFVYCSSDSAKSFLARSKALLKAVRALKIPSGKEGVEYLTVSIGA